MPSKLFLENLVVATGASQAKTILDYAKTELPVVKIKSIKILSNGQKEITLRNVANEEFSGVGDTKAEALAECVSLKYPA